jgi:ferritin-like metal-binding protein YciE
MENLHDLFEDTLRVVFYAENAIVNALPVMMEAVSSTALLASFSEHLEETKSQIRRLTEIFAIIGSKPLGKESHAILGLIQDTKELMSAKSESVVLDAGLLASMQSIEHYEMARYGTLRAWADELGLTDASRLLQQTLSEEKSADAKLSVLALSRLNIFADAGEVGDQMEPARSGPRSPVMTPPLVGQRQRFAPTGL